MIESKHIEKIAGAVVALLLMAVILIYLFADSLPDMGDGGKTMEYESALFNRESPITVDIQIDEDQWQELLDNALDETYYSCDVVINGEAYSKVGLRAKGNTSLSSIANDDDTDRYSLKIEFDQYINSQKCYGLDKLILNNNFADATMMKEYITYNMFKFLGADASLCNYAEVSVNGEYWGTYLALEAVEESFAERNYGVDYGDLYKPDSMEMGGAGKMRQFDPDDVQEMMENLRNQGEIKQTMGDAAGTEGAEADEQQKAGTAAGGGESAEGQVKEPSVMGGGPGMGGVGGMERKAGGADLNYIDDELDSYTTIWDASVFDTADKDHKRVIEALKNICQQNELETYMDVDNMLKYLAVQTFVVNLDGLAGNMTHNYYLYEEDGKLNLIPWDYNLAFGGFQSGSASAVINFAIDTPFSSGLEEREFFAGLLDNKEYLAQYHEYLRQLSEEYVDGGQLDEVYSRVRSRIDELVGTDPTSFFTYEEYDVAAEMLMQVIRLRADSVKGQMAGTIPSTTEGQNADGSALISGDGIDLSVMGSMGGKGGFGGGDPGGNWNPGGDAPGGNWNPGGDAPGGNWNPGDGAKVDTGNGESGAETAGQPEATTGTLDKSAKNDLGSAPDTGPENGPNDETTEQGSVDSDRPLGGPPEFQRDETGGAALPDGGNAVRTGGSSVTGESLWYMGGSFALILLAILVAVFWKRRK